MGGLESQPAISLRAVVFCFLLSDLSRRVERFLRESEGRAFVSQELNGGLSREDFRHKSTVLGIEGERFRSF